MSFCHRFYPLLGGDKCEGCAFSSVISQKVKSSTSHLRKYSQCNNIQITTFTTDRSIQRCAFHLRSPWPEDHVSKGHRPRLAKRHWLHRALNTICVVTVHYIFSQIAKAIIWKLIVEGSRNVFFKLFAKYVILVILISLNDHDLWTTSSQNVRVTTVGSRRSNLLYELGIISGILCLREVWLVEKARLHWRFLLRF